MSKIIEFNNNSQLLLEGCNAVADAVASTMGPKGRNVILKKTFGNPHVTKDGVSVAREIELDGIPGIGARLLVETAVKCGKRAGDGTTTATVLGRAIAAEGFKLTAAGFNPIGIQRGAKYAAECIIKELENMSKPVDTLDDIYSIALVSANGDLEISETVKSAFEKAGKDGVVIVEDSRDNDTHIEHSTGMKVDRGILHHLFVTNINKQLCEYDNPVVLLYEGKLDSQLEFATMLNNDAGVTPNGERIALGTWLENKPMIVVASDFSESMQQFFIYNRAQGMPVAIIKAPGFGDRQIDNLSDMATITGATVVSKSTGTTLANVNASFFGRCDKFISNMDESTFVGTTNANLLAVIRPAIKARIEEIEGQIADSKSDYDRDKNRERIARLSDGLVTIRVGGVTDVEVKEKKDRYDDAISAVKASYKKGTLPGGGVAFLRARAKCENTKLPTNDVDFVEGFKMLLKILEEPISVILKNGGERADLIIGKVIEEGINNPNMGYDARHSKYVDMVEEGIIDPTLVSVEALQNATSVGTLIFSSSCSVMEKPKEECGCEKQQPKRGF